MLSTSTRGAPVGGQKGEWGFRQGWVFTLTPTLSLKGEGADAVPVWPVMRM